MCGEIHSIYIKKKKKKNVSIAQEVCSTLERILAIIFFRFEARTNYKRIKCEQSEIYSGFLLLPKRIKKKKAQLRSPSSPQFFSTKTERKKKNCE